MTRIPGILIAFLVATTALAESADLYLAGSSPKAFELFFVVVNHGPDVAKNAVVTMDVSAALEIKRAFVGSHACDTSQRPIRCALGDLHAGLPAQYSTLELVAPIADATYNATVTVTSDTPDPNPGNQTLSGTWATKIEADLIVDVRTFADRVDPGDVVRFPWYLCNLVRGNATPRDVRIDFSATSGVFETLKTPDGFTCTIDGASAVCTAAEFNGQCPYNLDLTIRTNGDRSGGEVTVTARISSNVPERDPDNNQAVATTAIYRWITVDTTADDGPGSLRQAIGQANDHCSPGPCRIVFEIPPPVPPEGWFTITPLTPLPDITADRVTLEGARQTSFTGNTNTKGPEIAINGRLAGHGLKMRTNCEGVVNGLAIGNFREDEGLWISTGGYGTPPCPPRRPERVLVEGNYIGVDPAGSTPWPNRRGLRADGLRGSINLNTIRFNDFAGVWMWQGNAFIQHNWIADNGAAGISSSVPRAPPRSSTTPSPRTPRWAWPSRAASSPSTSAPTR